MGKVPSAQSRPEMFQKNVPGKHSHSMDSAYFQRLDYVEAARDGNFGASLENW